MPRAGAREIEVEDSYEAVQALFESKRWTDGLPVVPPTPERVQAMVAGSGLPAEHPVLEVPPRYALGTVEAIAVNAVMAGCRPGYMPVILAALDAMRDPVFNLYGIQATTHPSAPLVIVNGPVRQKLGIHCGSGCMGPGFRANATIGRAIRLVLLNIGGGWPGEGDMATAGAPSKYSYCFGENQEESPWEPLHVERGFRPEQSTVTVLAAEPPHNINDHSGRSADEVLTIVSGAVAVTGANNAYTGGETVLAFGPEHARTIAGDGLSKADVKREMRRRALVPLERYTEPTLVERFGSVPAGPVPMVRNEDDLIVIVAGGPGKHSAWIPTFGGATRSVTREVTGV